MPLRSVRTNASTIACGIALWLLFVLLELHHLCLTEPPTQHVERDLDLLRLPPLYFCPTNTSLKWHSFECLLSFKDDRNNCPVRLQFYRGLTPTYFQGHGGDGHAACLEFGTHMIGVRAEWSAAWNEITLRASFELEEGPGRADALQEVELGYLPSEWQIGARSSSLNRYYYPLLRVPMFFLTPPSRGPGVATRTYLAEEFDRSLAEIGQYFYTYGGIQIPITHASMPIQGFFVDDVHVVDWLVNDTGRRFGVVHVIITLEEFQAFEFRETTRFFPLLKAVGSITGVGALLFWLLVGRSVWSSHKQRGTGNEDLPWEEYTPRVEEHEDDEHAL